MFFANCFCRRVFFIFDMFLFVNSQFKTVSAKITSDPMEVNSFGKGGKKGKKGKR